MILEIIFSCVVGTLLHFTYEFSRHNKIVGIFSPVNESVWEHIKMALSPVFLCCFINLIVKGFNSVTIFSTFITLISVMIIILITFYAYYIFTKKELLITDIIIFYLAIILGFVLGNMSLNLNSSIFLLILGLLGNIFVLTCYFTFTIKPPKMFLFKDTITNKYGIEAHKCHVHKK